MGTKVYPATPVCDIRQFKSSSARRRRHDRKPAPAQRTSSHRFNTDEKQLTKIQLEFSARVCDM